MSLIDQINPNNCVNNRLRRANRIINRLYNKYIGNLDISLGQMSILFFVGKMKSVKQNEIGKFLDLERSTVTRELNGLLQKGYIKKTDDNVSPVISMMSKGNQFLNEVIPAWQMAQNEALQIIGTNGDEALNLLLNKIK